MTEIPLDPNDGTWLNPPVEWGVTDGTVTATAAAGSDLWRDTYYGFRPDTGHALLFDLPHGSAVELTVTAHLAEQFDQAGVLVRRDATTWVKAGVELADGVVGIGAVVTRDVSDWSSWPIPASSARRPIRMRVSWVRDALVVRARLDGEPWRLLRVAPWAEGTTVQAGPYLCAPSREGFSASFGALTTGPGDAALH